jgi:hypothetical protein
MIRFDSNWGVEGLVHSNRCGSQDRFDSIVSSSPSKDDDGRSKASIGMWRIWNVVGFACVAAFTAVRRFSKSRINGMHRINDDWCRHSSLVRLYPLHFHTFTYPYHLRFIGIRGTEFLPRSFLDGTNVTGVVESTPFGCRNQFPDGSRLRSGTVLARLEWSCKTNL